MKKLHYEFTGETTEVFGLTLHRIRATRDLPHLGVKAGDVGGWIEHTGNLRGNAWVGGEAKVSGNARVYENAKVFGNTWVLGYAQVSGDAEVYGEAYVYQNSRVCDSAKVYGFTRVYGNAEVSGNARIKDTSHYFHAVTYTSIPMHLTLTRQKNGGHRIIMGCWEGSIDKFEALIAQPKWIETKEEDVIEARPEMEILASLMRARIERWK